jgi:hypothetical protein
MLCSSSNVMSKHSFGCGSGPAFNLDASPDPDPGSQTNADPSGSGSWLGFDVSKSWILTKNILYVGNTVCHDKTYPGR